MRLWRTCCLISGSSNHLCQWNGAPPVGRGGTRGRFEPLACLLFSRSTQGSDHFGQYNTLLHLILKKLASSEVGCSPCLHRYTCSMDFLGVNSGAELLQKSDTVVEHVPLLLYYCCSPFVYRMVEISCRLKVRSPAMPLCFWLLSHLFVGVLHTAVVRTTTHLRLQLRRRTSLLRVYGKTHFCTARARNLSPRRMATW